jgi:DNA-binding SARP family transcriptional activator
VTTTTVSRRDVGIARNSIAHGRRRSVRAPSAPALAPGIARDAALTPWRWWQADGDTQVLQTDGVLLMTVPAATRDAGRESGPRMHLSVLRGFQLRSDNAVYTMPANVERVLAFLAVRERPQLRATVASMLWMDTTDERAAANLRTVLWKVRQAPDNWVVVSGSYMGLAPEVRVDLADVIGQAKRLIGMDDALEEADTDAEALNGDLLPEWDEDWILFERERLRQLRVHALEALCTRLSACGRHAEAVDAGQAAVAAEPFRESAQCTLITAHLAEGNRTEARRQYLFYADLLRDNLGFEPSDALRNLVGLTAIR